MDLVIREATVDDADGLGVAHVAAWRAAYPGLIPADQLAALDPAAAAARWRRIIEADDSEAVTLVAVAGGRVAGFVSYGPPRDPVEPDWGELWAINLHPDFWRQGIGTALFAAAADGLAGRGYRHGYLWVLDGNRRAIEFYRRQGWPPDDAMKIDDRYDPPRRELRCSGRFPRSARRW